MKTHAEVPWRFEMLGGELASREQWGEETGEHLADILRIP